MTGSVLPEKTKPLLSRFVVFQLLFMAAISLLFFWRGRPRPFPAFEEPAFTTTAPAVFLDPALDAKSPVEIEDVLRGFSLGDQKAVYEKFFAGKRVTWIGEITKVRVYPDGVHVILTADGWRNAVFGIWLPHHELARVAAKPLGYLIKVSGRLETFAGPHITLGSGVLVGDDQEVLAHEYAALRREDDLTSRQYRLETWRQAWQRENMASRVEHYLSGPLPAAPKTSPETVRRQLEDLLKMLGPLQPTDEVPPSFPAQFAELVQGVKETWPAAEVQAGVLPLMTRPDKQAAEDFLMPLRARIQGEQVTAAEN